MGEGLNNREERLHFAKCLIRVFKEMGFLDCFKHDFPRGADSIIQSIEARERQMKHSDTLHQLCLNYLWGSTKRYLITSNPPETRIGFDMCSELSKKYSTIASCEVIKLIDMMSSLGNMAERSKIAKAAELEYVTTCFRTSKELQNFIKENKKYCDPLMKCINEENMYLSEHAREIIKYALT